MPQSSIKAHMRRLFEPEAFHITNLTKKMIQVAY